MNLNQKRARMAIYSANKTKTSRQKLSQEIKKHYILTKGSFHQEYTKIINIYAPNIRVPQYVKQPLTELEGEITTQ